MTQEYEEKPESGTPIPGEADLAPQADVPAPEQQEQAADDTDARARAMGWVPKEEYRGPAERWKDASTFVKDGEENLPVLRERLRDTTRKFSELENQTRRQQADFNERAARLERMSTVALNRQRAQIEHSYEAAKREAVNFADTARYEQLEKDQRQALHQHDTVAYEAATYKPAPQQNRGNPQLTEEQSRTLDGWTARNSWFAVDAEMNAVAQAQHTRLMREKPGLSLDDNLRATEDYVRQRYPERFSISATARGPAPVESGSRRATSGQRAKGINELPAEARRAGESFVRQKIYKDLNEYAKEFWEQDA